jgi:hypothetical protein
MTVRHPVVCFELSFGVASNKYACAQVSLLGRIKRCAPPCTKKQSANEEPAQAQRLCLTVRGISRSVDLFEYLNIRSAEAPSWLNTLVRKGNIGSHCSIFAEAGLEPVIVKQLARTHCLGCHATRTRTQPPADTMAILVGPLQDVCLSHRTPVPRPRAAWPRFRTSGSVLAASLPLTHFTPSEATQPNQPRASPLGASGPPPERPQLNVPEVGKVAAGMAWEAVSS